MPFYKTHEIPQEFSKIFLEQCAKLPLAGDNRLHFMLPVPLHGGGTENFMVRYHNRSGASSVEDIAEYYPCIVIQDFQPELDKTKLWGKDYVEGIFDEVNSMVEVITLPIPLICRFQVSVVTKRLKEAHSAMDWFFNNFNFQRPGSLLMNKVASEEGDVGDVVQYSATFGEVPREDNRFEYAFTYELDTYIHAKSKPYMYNADDGFVGGNFYEAIEKIKLSLIIRDYSEFANVIKENFSIDGPISVEEIENFGSFVTKAEFDFHKINPNTHLNLIVDGGVIT